MNKKAAIGLSMNMLVVIILSIVILVGGVALMYNFIDSANQQKKVLDSKTSAELERLLIDQGKMVALPLQKVALVAGDSHLFGIGILNIGEGSNDFSIEIETSQMIDKFGKIDELSDAEKQQIADTWLLYDDSVFTIQENEHRKETISVNVPKDVPKGEYIFNVYIKSGDRNYGNTQKFYVKVS